MRIPAPAFTLHEAKTAPRKATLLTPVEHFTASRFRSQNTVDRSHPTLATSHGRDYGPSNWNGLLAQLIGVPRDSAYRLSGSLWKS